MNVRISAAFFALVVAPVGLAADSEPKTVFKIGETRIAGQPGHESIYKYYREPNAIVTESGALIVVCGPHHVAGRNDRAHQDLLVRRSLDDGDTWDEARLIADEGMHSLLPTCLVYDEQIDRTLLLINVIHNAPGSESKECRQFVMYSDDDGETWSERREILKGTDALCVFGGGHGFQIEHGPNKGRLVVPGGNARNFLCYSDDHGQSWTLARTPSPGRREATAAELRDGTIIVGNRNKGFGITFVRSADGGRNWAPPETVLPDAWGSCNNSLLAVEDGDEELLLYLAPVGPKNADKYTLESEAKQLKRGVEDSRQSARMNGVLFFSRDSGKSWKGVAVAPGWVFGYNCLTRLKSGDIGVVFEGAPATSKGWAAVKASKKDHNTGALLGIYFVKVPIGRLK